MNPALHNRIEQRVLQLAQENGVSPGQLTPALYRTLYARAYREHGQLAQAAGSAISSATRVLVGKKVAKEKSEANKRQCVECPHNKFAQGRDGRPLCRACGCAGKFLQMKWMDPKQHCPLTISGKRCDFAGDTSPDDPSDPPVWDNRGAEQVDQIDEVTLGGDRSASK